MISFLLMLTAITASAQSTARKFVLKNSSDGLSELTCYLPKNPSGRAVVDCPGGGYSHLAMDHEGHQWAEYFNKQGIAFFVLKYRMPNGNRNIPLSDAYQAMRTVRDIFCFPFSDLVPLFYTIPMLPERKRADFPLQSTLFHALYHSLQALSTDSKVKNQSHIAHLPLLLLPERS